jgi:nucleotide-binding universal stress UspA family protein
MFKHILVPLDGSHLAEAALPAAVMFSRTLKAEVTLLHVIEQDAPEQVHRDRHLTDAREAKEYLKDVAKRYAVRGDVHVHRAPVQDVAESLVHHARDGYQPDLIILTAHGSSGMHDLVFGNIAQQVTAMGTVPVLLLKPSLAASSFTLENILVPLDNESVHDSVLPLTRELAAAFHARLDLLCVIPTLVTDSGAHAAAGTMLPMTASAYLDIAEEIAEEHFQIHLDEFQRQHIPATAEIARGDPAAVIARSAKDKVSDLILFGTHGRSGTDAFWNRSTAAAVARRTAVPLLLVPLHSS